MKVFKAISNTVANIAYFIEGVTNLGNELVGDTGLKATTNLSMTLINESLDQSVKMSRIEARQEMAAFLEEHSEFVTETTDKPVAKKKAPVKK